MMNKQQQTVFIVDDDVAVRDSIQELVESVGLQAKVYSSALAFLDALEPQHSGCLVLDVRMAGMSGLVLQEKLVEMDATLPVIVLTAHGDVPLVIQMMKAGAVDFLQKPYRDQSLLDSINAALSMNAEARQPIDDLEVQLTTLTQREQEVLDQIQGGLTSKEVARKLDISPRTVEAHRTNLLRKLGVGSVKELMSRLVAPHQNS